MPIFCIQLHLKVSSTPKYNLRTDLMVNVMQGSWT